MAAVVLVAAITSLADIDRVEAGAPIGIEVRVWQSVEDEAEIYASARIKDGSWGTLGTFLLPLDDGSTQGFRFGVFTIDTPRRDEPPAYFEVRVWQHVQNTRRIDIEARPQGGTWLTLGRVPLALDDGLSSSRRYRYGDIVATLPLSTLPWYRLDGPTPCPSVHPPGSGRAYWGPPDRLIVAAVCYWIDEAGEIRSSRIWELYLGYNLWDDVQFSGYERNLTFTFFDSSYVVYDETFMIDGRCVLASSLALGTGIAGPLRSFASLTACVRATGDEGT